MTAFTDDFPHTNPVAKLMISHRWESAWRLAQWDLDLGKTEEESHTNGTDEMDGWNFHKHLFHSLQCLRHQEAGGLMHHALQAKKGVISQIRNVRLISLLIFKFE